MSLVKKLLDEIADMSLPIKSEEFRNAFISPRLSRFPSLDTIADMRLPTESKEFKNAFQTSLQEAVDIPLPKYMSLEDAIKIPLPEELCSLSFEDALIIPLPDVY